MRPRTALLLTALCLLAYGLLSAASLTGPPGRRVGITFDEPLHAVGAWHVRHRGDYRVNREDPALFLHYISLRTPHDAVAVAYDDAAWQETRPGTFAPRHYLRRAVYGDPEHPQPQGFVPEAVVHSARWGALLTTPSPQSPPTSTSA